MAKRRTIRRFVTMAIVFLLLGVIVNVAVAWGCVLWRPDVNKREKQYMDWPIELPVDFALVRQYGAGIELFGTTSIGAWNLYRQDDRRIDLLLAGWPMRSLYSLRSETTPWIQSPATRFDQPDDFWDGIAIPSWLSKSRTTECFPTRPVWYGFMFNTIFSAVLIWFTMALFIAMRTWRRVRRGLCRKCKYPIGSSPVCTECGAAVRAVR